MWNMKRIGLTASEEKSFENVDDGRTDDGHLYILKAHLWAFGSGELINTHKVKRHRNSDTKTGSREPQQNYRLGTVSNELLGGLN